MRISRTGSNTRRWCEDKPSHSKGWGRANLARPFPFIGPAFGMSDVRPPPIPLEHLGREANPERGFRFLERVRARLRSSRYSRRTEIAYIDWIRRFVLFHGRKHPLEMGEAEIAAFLTDLAVVQKVSASTQNQALHALLFMYRHVLHLLERSHRPRGTGGGSTFSRHPAHMSSGEPAPAEGTIYMRLFCSGS